jgi:toxin-antitoxin system PIN domain toxin
VILADLNVLISAYRQDAKHHAVCRGWLDRTIASEAFFGTAPLALSAVIRITSNRRIFNPPSDTGHAFLFCNALLAQPHCSIVHPGGRHWSIFQRLCLEAAVRADLVTDAWFAALAIEHGCEWITLDRDFKRFSGLRWRYPD